MRTPTDWKNELEQNSLAAFAPLLLQHWQPCLRLKLEPAGYFNPLNGEGRDETPVGNSKLGGWPDLPSDFEWPAIEDAHTGDVVAIPFLAQIRLEEIADMDEERALPSSGLLSFFFDFIFGYGVWKVVYFPHDSGQLVRTVATIATANPSSFGIDAPYWGIESPYRLHFEQSSSLPPVFGSELEAPFERIAQENGITTQNDIDTLMDNYQLLRVGANGAEHQVLGFANVGFARAEAAAWGLHGDQWHLELEQITEKEVGEWRLLFQLDQDDKAGFSVGSGAGVIAFFIREEDLKNANFDYVYASYFK